MAGPKKPLEVSESLRRHLAQLRTSADDGATSEPKRPKEDHTPPSGSVFNFEYGQVQMKGYPVSRDELSELAKVGGGVGVCFTIAGIIFGMVWDAHKDLVTAKELDDAAKIALALYRSAGIVVCLIFVLGGLSLMAAGQTKIQNIKARTKFISEAAYVPSRWPKIFIYGAMAVCLASLAVMIYRAS